MTKRIEDFYKNYSVLVCAGQSLPAEEKLVKLLKNASYLCAADAGWDLLEDLKIKPNLLLGDFDSSRENLAKKKDIIEKEGIEFYQYPVKKNATDSELGLDILHKKGFKRVILLGGIGSRMDHSICNLLMLKSFSMRGMDVRLETRHNRICFLEKGIYQFPVTPKSAYTSFITMDPDILLSLEGFEYNLNKTPLIPCQSLGVSNHVISEENRVEIFARENEGVFAFESFDK